MNLCAVIQSKSGMMSWIAIFCPSITFYMATLEAKITDKMIFGVINAPVEGNLYIVLLYFYCAIFGNAFWPEFSEFPFLGRRAYNNFILILVILTTLFIVGNK